METTTMEFIINEEIRQKAAEWVQHQKIEAVESTQVRGEEGTLEYKQDEIQKTHILELKKVTSLPETTYMYKENNLTVRSKIGKYRIIAFKHIGDIFKNLEKIANLLDSAGDVSKEISEAKKGISLALGGVIYGILQYFGLNFLSSGGIIIMVSHLTEFFIDTLFASEKEKEGSIQQEKIKWISYIYIFTNPNTTVKEFNAVFGSILNAILSIPEIPKILQSLIITFDQQDKIKLNKDFVKNLLYIFYEKLSLDGSENLSLDGIKIRTLRDVDAFKYFKFKYFTNLNLGIGKTTSTTIIKTLKTLDKINRDGKVAGIFCSIFAAIIGEEDTCPKLSAKPLYNKPKNEEEAIVEEIKLKLYGIKYFNTFKELLRQLLIDYFPAKIGLRTDKDKSVYMAIKQEELKLLQSGLSNEEQGEQLTQYFQNSELDYDISNLNWIIEILRLITVHGGLIDNNQELFERLLGFLSVIIDTFLDTLNDEVHRGGKKRKTKRRQKNRKSKKSKRKLRNSRKK